MLRIRWSVLEACLLIWACSMSQASAATLASDNASDPAYAAEADGAWKGENPTEAENPPGMDNGGMGFMPWDFTGGFHDPVVSAYGQTNHFIDGVDFTASTFNDLGSPAFGLTNAAQSDIPTFTTQATRRFAEPMEVGNIFSADFDTPAVYDPLSSNHFPFAIIAFGDANGDTTFLIEAGSSLDFGDFNWRYDDLNNDNFDTGIVPTATSDGSSLSLELTSMTTATVVFDEQTFNIDFIFGVPASVNFTLFANASGDGMGNPTGEREFFFNNLLITDGAQEELPGDLNGDGQINFGDLTPFVTALTDPAAYETMFPELDRVARCDASGDGMCNFSDLTPFVALLTGGSAGGSAVPEPATIGFVILLIAINVMRIRCR
jgi:hypothetical protein